jgi:hypothetical protein
MTLILSGTDGLSDVDGSAATPAIRGTDANTGIFFPAADTIAFSEGGVESMRINSSGNVGIGTDTPLSKLEVNGGAANTYVRIVDTRATYPTYIGAEQGSTVFGRWGLAESMRIDSSGNVGIGTSSPNEKLQVNGAILSTGSLSAVRTSAASMDFLSGNTRFISMGADGSTKGGFIFYNSTNAAVTEAARIDSSGRLLVGTTSTTGIAGNGVKITSNAVGSTSTVALTLEGTGGDFYALKCVGVDMHLLSVASGGSPYWSFGSSTATAMLLQANGDVRMPTVYGRTVTTPRNMFIDSSGTLGGISSIRASKNNITPITDSAWLYQVSPVTFNYRKRDEDGNYLDEVESETQYGLIAEDVEAVRPEFCIYVEKDGQQVLQGVHYDRMISPLIKALQEQQAIITQLQADVAALQAPQGTP